MDATQAFASKHERRDALEALSRILPAVLNRFPLWSATNLSIGSHVPCIPGLFDLAILDEASQCDIASAIPVLFRARRVAIVGDPHQLSHTSSINAARDALLRKRRNIVGFDQQRFSFPLNSLYDLCAHTTGAAPILLRETYRSASPIAEYSNRNFYGGRLEVRTAADRLRVPRGLTPGIHWTEVESEVLRSGPSGCFAPKEVETVSRVVASLLIEDHFEGTIGIVTPFVQQRKRIIDHLYEIVPPNVIEAAALHVDTAHGFQGDERDVILLSLCAGPHMPRGSLCFLRESGNLMNVAVSRARAVLHVIGNRYWAASCGIRHIEDLARISAHEVSTQSPSIPSRWGRHESPWEKVVYDALVAKGLSPHPQHLLMGRRLDLALIREGDRPLKVDIEVDGDCCHRNPDGTRKRDDVWRDIQIKGAGWKVMRFWVYQLRENLDGCIQRILEVWEDGTGK
jgi:very-short-patch-repair endonuclease